jgi:hypothetical protein
MAAPILGTPAPQFVDTNGNPLVSGKVFVYAPGTTTPRNSYPTADDADAQTNANTNPVILDGNGYAVGLWGRDDTGYKIAVQNSAGVVQWTQDDIQIGDPGLKDQLASTSDVTLGSALVGYKRYGAAGATGTTVYRKLRDLVLPSDFGAVGDGVADDTAALSNALNSGYVIDGGGYTYRVTSEITVSVPCTFLGGGNTTIIPAIGLSGSKLFAFETDDVIVDGLIVDGTGLTFVPSTQNKYAFFGGDGTTKYNNHQYTNNRIINWSYSDGNTGAANLLTSHCIYVDNVDNVTVQHNVADTAAGAFFFGRDITGLTITYNKALDCIWYPIHLVGGCFDFEIGWNVIDASGIPGGIYWGGGIDLMSQHSPLEVRNKQGYVHDNYLTGYFSYGAAMRISSIDDLVVERNLVEDWDAGSNAVVSPLSGIRLNTRGTGVGAENGPCQNVTIRNNTIRAPTTAGLHLAIYASNEFQSARTPARGLRIYDNEIESTDGSVGFAHAVVVHGNEGGWEDVYIENNTATTLTAAGSVGTGAISLLASSADGMVEFVYIGGNNMRDLGTPAGSGQVGIGLGAYVNQVIGTEPNRLQDYFYGVRTSTNCGVDIRGFYSQDFIECTNPGLFVTATANPSSLNDGDGETIAITTNGMDLGVPVLTSFAEDLQGVTVTPYVSAANTVSLRFQNESGGVVNLGSARVRRRRIMPQEARLIFAESETPGSIANGAQVILSITATGAELGDFVVPYLSASAQGLTVTAYVSATNTCRVVLQNETGGAIDLGTLTVGVYVLNRDPARMVTDAYDPGTINDAAGATTTLTLPGLEIGDYVVASFGANLLGVTVTPYISARDTVSIRFQNESGSNYTPGSQTLAVMYFRPEEWD